jgi:MerR family transcriptional regulator, light-induced transcriptional regulator
MGEYKISDIEILTGIKAHTLRIWEKRYGIPNPSRTGTKIRNYSDDDLTEILNVAILNKNGLKISHIAELNSAEKRARVLSLWEKDADEIHQESLLLALMELDEFRFHHTLELLIQKFGVVDTYTKHIAKFLERIGLLWITGSIHPGQEHFMSHLIRQKLMALTDSLPMPEKEATCVLLFLPENEWHELGLIFYHYVLRSRGINSFFLGQSLPYDAVLKCVERLNPDALLTVCVAPMEEGFYENYFEKLSHDTKGIPIYASGGQMKNYEEKLSKWIRPVSSVDDLGDLV